MDPDARLMCNNNGSVMVAYNVQASVDSENNMVLDYEVTTKPNDQGQLGKMGCRAKEFFEQEQITVLADKGYYQSKDLKICEDNNIVTFVAKQTFSNSTGDPEYYKDKFRYIPEEDSYICPQNIVLTRVKIRKENGVLLGYDYENKSGCRDCPVKEKCTKNKTGRRVFRQAEQDVLDRVDERTSRNKELYKKRQTIVEPVFGTIKRAHNSNYLLVKGLKMVRCETALFFLSYNFKRAFNTIGVPKLLKILAKSDSEAA